MPKRPHWRLVSKELGKSCQRACAGVAALPTCPPPGKWLRGQGDSNPEAYVLSLKQQKGCKNLVSNLKKQCAQCHHICITAAAAAASLEQKGHACLTALDMPLPSVG
eukprot:366390-Chlamydomonas_euryale.AAC.26